VTIYDWHLVPTVAEYRTTHQQHFANYLPGILVVFINGRFCSNNDFAWLDNRRHSHNRSALGRLDRVFSI
jgi:hypothetical protein